MKIEISVLVADELRNDAAVTVERVLARRLRMAADAAGVEMLAGPSTVWSPNTDLWSMGTFEWSAVCSAPIAGPVITTAEVELLDLEARTRGSGGVRMASVPNGETW